ncbi:MAG: YdcF family protein [Psychrosphaera sp.]|nr:YdcF family protein [Psychrosphaera sp.]
MIIFLCYLMLLWGKKNGLSKFIMGLAITTLYLLSTPYGANQVLAPLEFKYAKFKQPDLPLAYIVVLGCAHQNNEFLPPSSRLAPCSQIRVLEGLELYQNNPGSKVFFSGGGHGNENSLAQNMAIMAKKIGIASADIIIEERVYNTSEEASYLASEIVDAQAALVTSAAHMPRAMLLFENQGLDLIPAPTDYLIRERITSHQLRYFIPEVTNLAKVNAAAHEYYGFWWISLSEFFG